VVKCKPRAFQRCVRGSGVARGRGKRVERGGRGGIGGSVAGMGLGCAGCRAGKFGIVRSGKDGNAWGTGVMDYCTGEAGFNGYEKGAGRGGQGGHDAELGERDGIR
jgi:hypothetical protein